MPSLGTEQLSGHTCTALDEDVTPTCPVSVPMRGLRPVRALMVVMAGTPAVNLSIASYLCVKLISGSYRLVYPN